MRQEIQNYIKLAKEYGMSNMEIKKNLLDEGWEAKDIEEAFVQAKAQENKLFENKDEDINILKKEYKSTPALALKGPEERSYTSPKMEEKGLNVEQKNEPAPSEQKAQTTSTISSPKITAEENHSEMIRKNKKFQKKLIIGIIITIIFIIAGYFGYSYAFNNPSKIWNNFISNSNSINDSYKQKLKISYTDETPNKKNKQGENEKKIVASFTMDSYIQATDPKKSEIDSRVSLKLASGETNFEQGLNFKIIGNAFYFKISDIPAMKNIIPQTAGKETNWIKIDINELEDYLTNSKSVLGAQIIGQNLLAQNNTQADTNNTTNKKDLDKKFKNDLETIWKNKKFWGVDKYIGSEKINGIKTAHFKNFFKKEEFRVGFDKSLDLLGEYLIKQKTLDTGESKQSGFDTDLKEKITEIKNPINKFIDKIEIKEFETWIGFKNFRLYKFNLITNAPSLNSINNSKSNYNIPILGEAQAKSRDAKRLADIRQMATALELYFNDKNGYPEEINGVPQNISPFYIGAIPKPPKPADGVCGDYYNAYWYEAKGKSTSANGENFYPDYELTFCLGQAIGGYPAGIAKLSPKGIEGGIVCKAEDPNCQKNNNETNFLDMPFTAELKIDMQFSDYGVKKEIKAPTNAKNLLEGLFPDLYNNSNNYKTGDLEAIREMNRDAKRLADVRQLSTALELYFNDFLSYPDTLEQLIPNYIGKMFEAPNPPDGDCSFETNIYFYKQLKGGQKYEMTFCLGSDTNGYQKGVRTMTIAGIK